MKSIRFSSRRYFGQSVADIRRKANGSRWFHTPLTLSVLFGAAVLCGPPLQDYLGTRRLTPPPQTLWAQKLEADGVVLRTDAGQPMTEAECQLAWQCLHRVPETVRRSCLENAPLELISGSSIQTHPRYRDAQGPVPGRAGTDWSAVIGIAAGDHTVVLANKHVEYHGQMPCVLLHEVGHQFDRAHHWLSNTSRWQELHHHGHWRAYALPYPDESFAEAFAEYYASPETRAKLPDDIRAYMAERVRVPLSPRGTAAPERVLICTGPDR